jgi:D-citramalate synthase
VVTTDDLPYIIADVLKQDRNEEIVKILNYSLSLTHGLRPVATINIRINGHDYQATATGDGQYNAFVQALKKIYKRQLKRDFPKLQNYTVTIPPGGRTDAFVQTMIVWEYEGEKFRTRGLDADQTESAIKATIKMLNKIEIIEAQKGSASIPPQESHGAYY